MRKSHLIGLPVLDIACGRLVGNVQSVLINPAALTAAGLLLKSRGWRGPLLVLEMGRVHRIGKDAVTVKDATQIERLADRPELRDWIAAATALERARLVTRGGTLVGETADFSLDPEKGAITGFVLHRGPWVRLRAKEPVLPVRYVVCAGPDAIVVDDQAERCLAGQGRPLGSTADVSGDTEAKPCEAPVERAADSAQRGAERVGAWLRTSVSRAAAVARAARDQFARRRDAGPNGTS